MNLWNNRLITFDTDEPTLSRLLPTLHTVGSATPYAVL